MRETTFDRFFHQEMDGKKEDTLTRGQIKEQELLDEYETDRLAHA